MSDRENPYEREGRERKANNLVAVIAAIRELRMFWSNTAEDFAGMDDAGWAALAELAKVNPPSPKARERVVELLRKREEAERQFIQLEREGSIR